MTEEQADYITYVGEMMGWNEPKQIITELSGFVPVFDCVLQRYKDIVRASVHGAMWRFCQMEDKVCKASLSTIGEMIGTDKATVNRHAKELCKDGYFVDLTPDLKNKPHVYADTGAVQMRNRFSVAQNNVGVAQNNASVAESRLNKVFNKDINTPKKGDVIDGMIEYAKREHVNYPLREKIPEPYIEYSDWYVKTTGQKPRKAVLSDWLLTFDDWTGAGISAKDLDAAYQHATRPNGGFMVSRPGSLTNTAIALKAKPSTTPKIDNSEIERTRKMLEERDNKKFVPPPVSIRELAKQKGIK